MFYTLWTTIRHYLLKQKYQKRLPDGWKIYYVITEENPVLGVEHRTCGSRMRMWGYHAGVPVCPWCLAS